MSARVSKTLVKGQGVNYLERYYFCENADEDENEFVSGELLDENLVRIRKGTGKVMSIRYTGITEEDWRFIKEEIEKCGMSFVPTSLPPKEGYFRVRDENGVSKYVPASDVLSFDEFNGILFLTINKE